MMSRISHLIVGLCTAVALSTSFVEGDAARASSTPIVGAESVAVTVDLPHAIIDNGIRHADPPDASQAVRARTVLLDHAVIHRAAQRIHERPRISFDLFDDVTVVAAFDDIAFESAHRFSLIGRADRIFGSTIVITAYDGAIYGMISAPPVGTFELRPTGDGLHHLRQIDGSPLLGCGVGPAQGIALPEDPDWPGGVAGDDATYTVNVLAVYTPLVLEAFEFDTNAVLAMINNGVTTANTALKNSAIDLEMHLSGAKFIVYEESGDMALDLERLAATDDGYLDSVHLLREATCADLVAMYVAEGQACGIAYVMQTPSPDFGELAFSVTNADPLCVPPMTFTHEVGHNMGCAHAHGDPGIPGTYSFSHGYRFSADPASSTLLFRTVMAYPDGQWIAHFSNPLVDVEGEPSGVLPGLPEPAYNALTIDSNAPVFTAFGEVFCPDPIHVPDDFPTIQAAINAAADGAVILVAAGTYPETINLLGKSIQVRSEDGPATTIIDGQDAGTVVTCNSGEDSETMINGFTITGGSALRGGGIVVNQGSPTFFDCVVADNDATWGGGLSSQQGAPTFIFCTFTDNTATLQGGGAVIENGEASFVSSVFSSNQAPHGGAVYNAHAEPYFTGTTFENNSADDGGAVYNHDSTPLVELSTISNNLATGTGGGMFSNNASAPEATLSTFCDNTPNDVVGPLVDLGLNDICEYAILVPEEFATIQEAIDIAGEGASIIVSPGIYNEHINLLGKDIHLQSSDGPLVTTISGIHFGSVVTCTSGETLDTVIEGFTIINGDTDFGAGVRIIDSSPSIVNCIIESNTASVGGGGVYAQNSVAKLTNTIIRNNVAENGGGLYNHGSQTVITGCTFDANVATDDGGAIVNTISSNPLITDSTFDSNTAGDAGGAIRNSVNSVSSVLACTFRSNAAVSGGGMSCTLSSPASINNSLFCENTPDHVAGSCQNLQGNSFLDVCPPIDCAPVDLNCDGVVDGTDLAMLLGAWGDCPPPDPKSGGPCGACPADITGDCQVNGADLATLLGDWN